MINGEPSDISEARELLRDFERSEDHSERMRKLEDALDLLNPYLSDHDKTGQLAKNLRRTYTRKLLEKLSSLDFSDIDDWFPYSLLLLTELEEDVDYLCAENEQLKESFNEFISIWADLVREVIQRHPN